MVLMIKRRDLVLSLSLFFWLAGAQADTPNVDTRADTRIDTPKDIVREPKQDEAAMPGVLLSKVPDYGPWVQEPPPGDFFLLMDKSRNQLTVQSLSQPGLIFKTYHSISGENLGDKEREGDKKTPEGIYFIESKIPRSRLTALHGAAAFELNYPNPVDRIAKRTGFGIWIHGVDNEKRLERRFDTLGCVAVSNPDILDLAQRLTFKNIPIVIVPEINSPDLVGVEPDGGPFHARVMAWATAWSSRDPEAYLAFYHPDFRGRGMNYGQWSAYKRRLAKVYSEISVDISNLRILRHGKYSVAIFDQHYRSDRFESRSRKRLYLVGDPAEARILAEEAAEQRSEAGAP